MVGTVERRDEHLAIRLKSGGDGEDRAGVAVAGSEGGHHDILAEDEGAGDHRDRERAIP